MKKHIILSLTALLLSLAPSYANEPIAVEASIVKPIEQLAENYAKTHKTGFEIISTSSSNLASQIQKGFPMTLLIVEEGPWIKDLQNKNIISDVHPFAQTDLVLWVPPDIDGLNLIFNLSGVKIQNDQKISPPILEYLQNPKTTIAIADPQKSQSGALAKKLLEDLQVYDPAAQQDRIQIYATAAQAFISTANENAKIAIVPKTIALKNKGGSTLNLEGYQITYTGALINATASDKTKEFWQHIRSPQAEPTLSSFNLAPIK